MADGVSTTVANSALDNMAGTNMAAAQLHTGAPGSAGTANVASVTTRPAVTWGSASGASKAANGTLPSWNSWAGTNGQTVTAISLWSSTTPGSGTFGAAITLSASVTMNTGDNLSLTAITISLPTAS